MKDLLICIAHHHTPDRLQYLQRVLKAFADEYPLSHDIIIDTNLATLDVKGEDITVVGHASLSHPFHLTWMHRQHMKERIEDYGCFMYTEDDIYLPFENFQHYLHNFELLWPAYVPSFTRVEALEGEEFLLDVTERHECHAVLPSFCTLKEPYHGFWILPQEALKQTMTPDFVRLLEWRELAAAYPIWELHKTPLIEFDSDGVNRKCLAYHLPNNYAPCPTSPHSKIKLANIFLRPQTPSEFP